MANPEDKDPPPGCWFAVVAVLGSCAGVKRGLYLPEPAELQVRHSAPFNLDVELEQTALKRWARVEELDAVFEVDGERVDAAVHDRRDIDWDHPPDVEYLTYKKVPVDLTGPATLQLEIAAPAMASLAGSEGVLVLEGLATYASVDPVAVTGQAIGAGLVPGDGAPFEFEARPTSVSLRKPVRFVDDGVDWLDVLFYATGVLGVLVGVASVNRATPTDAG